MRPLISNFLYRLAYTLLNFMVPILVYPYIYRVIGATNMGKAEYAFSFVEYFVCVAGLGLSILGVRELSKVRTNPEKSNKVFSSFYVFSIAIGILLTIAYFLFATYFFKDFEIRNLLYIYGLYMVGTFLQTDWVHESFERYKYISIRAIILRILFVLSIFLFIKSQQGFYIYALLVASICFVGSIINIFMLKHTKVKILPFKKGYFADINILSIMLTLIIISYSTFYSSIDKIFLGYFCTKVDVAYYSLGQKVFYACSGFAATITAVSIPRLSFHFSNNREDFHNLLNIMIRSIFLLVLPICAGCIFLRHEIVTFLGGSAYIAAEPVVALFGFRVLLIACAGILLNQILFLFGREKFIAIVLVFGLILNFCLKYIISEFYGLSLISATLSTIIIEMMLLIVFYLYISRKLKLNLGIFVSHNFKYFLCSSCFLPIILLIKSFNLWYITTMILSCFFCSLFYGISLYITNDESFVQLIAQMRSLLRSRIKHV